MINHINQSSSIYTQVAYIHGTHRSCCLFTIHALKTYIQLFCKLPYIAVSRKQVQGSKSLGIYRMFWKVEVGTLFPGSEIIRYKGRRTSTGKWLSKKITASSAWRVKTITNWSSWSQAQ